MERMKITSQFGAQLIGAPGIGEESPIIGWFTAELFDSAGRLKWRDKFPNTVVTVGKNILLNTLFTGSAYTVNGPFMGMIALTSFSAIAASDTMASHPGWLEAGGTNAPQYNAPRPTSVFAAASGGVISLSTPTSFTFSANGTVKGGFITLGPGASATIDSTGGVLFSAGLFTGGDRTVAINDVLNISYSCTLT